jgi:hypothetical protein
MFQRRAARRKAAVAATPAISARSPSTPMARHSRYSQTPVNAQVKSYAGPAESNSTTSYRFLKLVGFALLWLSPTSGTRRKGNKCRAYAQQSPRNGEDFAIRAQVSWQFRADPIGGILTSVKFD